MVSDFGLNKQHLISVDELVQRNGRAHFSQKISVSTVFIHTYLENVSACLSFSVFVSNVDMYIYIDERSTVLFRWPLGRFYIFSLANRKRGICVFVCTSVCAVCKRVNLPYKLYVSDDPCRRRSNGHNRETSRRARSRPQPQRNLCVAMVQRFETRDASHSH